MIAAREALRQSGLDLSDGIATALVSATTVGGMDKTEVEFSWDECGIWFRVDPSLRGLHR